MTAEEIKLLKTFSRGQLCLARLGEKWHIRNGNHTYCGLDSLIDIGAGVIGVREDYECICKRCLKQYHKEQPK